MELFAKIDAATATMALAFLVLSAEVIARLWIRSHGRYFVWRPHYKMRIELNQAMSPFLKSPIHVRSNSAGERGRELPKTKGKLYRMLVAGGSTAECRLIDQDKTWSAVLEQILEANKGVLGADAVHLGNISRSEVEGAPQRLTLEKVLPRYPHLDLIILFPGISTVTWWLRDGCPSGRPAKTLPLERLFDQSPDIHLGWHPRNSALAEIAKRWLFRFTGYSRVLSGSGNMKIAAAYQRSRVREFYSLTQDPAGMVNGFAQELRKSIGLAKAKATRVILVRPLWFQKDRFTAEEEAEMWIGWVGTPVRRQQWQFVSHRDLFRLFAMIDERAAQIGREMEVEVLDLKHLLEPRLGIFYDNCHLTEEGAALAARHIASLVLGQRVHPIHVTEQKSGAYRCQRQSASRLVEVISKPLV